MEPHEYIDIGLPTVTTHERDKYFKNLYEEKGFLQCEIDEIIDNTNEDWKEVLYSCFSSIKNGDYKIAIPFLFSYIENQIAKILDTTMYGYKLKKEYESKLRTSIEDKDSTTYIFLKAVYVSSMNVYNASSNFKEERPNIINRNWVMHGRDDPRLWTITDVYKLLSVLSGIAFIMDDRYQVSAVQNEEEKF
jgi:hypothetical protein